VATALVGAAEEDLTAGAVFYKMSGSGNDFLVFDGRYNPPERFTSSAVQSMCDRRQGAGADGVIVLTPGGPENAHFTFNFWNSDGSLGPMCGNGALCATRLASLIELAPPEGEIRFATRAGLHRGLMKAGRPTIYLPDCDRPVQEPGIELEPGETSPAWLCRPSVPHLVVLCVDVDAVDIRRRGPLLRHHKLTGPGGANANWISPVGDGTWRMRTWERGVEGETLACGTGAVACALVLGEARLATAPVRIWTRSRRELDVDWRTEGGRVTSLTLSGEGRVVYRGVIGEPAGFDPATVAE